MKPYEATEIAYKKGYKQGVKDFAERVLNEYAVTMYDEVCVVYDTDIYNLAKEMGVE